MNNNLSGLTQQADPAEVEAALKEAYGQVAEDRRRLRDAEPSDRLRELISDGLIERVWGSANFGDTSKRQVIREALLKFACGYHSGRTATYIIRELGLVSRKKWALTKLGQEYLYEAYEKGNSI